MDELWDVYTKDRKKTGAVISRSKRHDLKDDEFHLWIMVWIRDPKTGRFLISRRSPDKEADPLKYETVAGHALLGETSLEAAMREAYEEVGIDLDPSRGRLISTKIVGRADGVKHNHIRDAFLFETASQPDLDAATTKEVISCGWLTLGEIKQLYDSGLCCESVREIFDFMSNPVPEDRYAGIIGLVVKGKTDRPMGSFHPRKHDLYYPVNYGYLYDYVGGDGSKQDVYLLGIDHPADGFTARVIAVYHRYDDNETKWIAVPCDENGDIAKDARVPDTIKYTPISPLWNSSSSAYW